MCSDKEPDHLTLLINERGRSRLRFLPRQEQRTERSMMALEAATAPGMAPASASPEFTAL